MTEPTDWRAKLGEAMVGVFERTRELPAEPWRIPLVRSLAVVSNGLTSPAADPEAMLASMASAVREALALEAAGLVDADLVSRLEPAFIALTGHRDRSLIDDLVRPPAEPEPILKASRGIPNLLVVAFADDVEVDEVHVPEALAEVVDTIPESAETGALPEILWEEDPERYDPDEPPPPLVKLADEGGEPRALLQFYDAIADRALRKIAMLARHRSERRMTEWAAEERRILAASDAIVATGPQCVKRVEGWWAAALESPDPWKTWAPCFVLGVIDGAVPLRGIRDGLRMLPDAAARHAELAGEALVLSPHPDLVTLAKELRADSHPVVRAVGVDVASKLGQLSPEEVDHHLADPSPAVTLAAVRAAIRCDPPSPALQASLVLWMHHDDRAVAFAAARALMLLGRVEPLVELRRQGKLVSRLGPLGVIELLVLGGDAQDLGLLQSLLARCKVTAAHLAGVARIGHPGTWAFLLHYLAEKDFEDPASEALFTLFGDRVPWKARLNTTAWRDAIAAGRFDPDQRIRRGEPWSPAVVAAECNSTSALLSRYDVEQRVDELAVRTGVPARVDMCRWSPIATPALVAYLAKMSQVSRSWTPGRWTLRSQ